MKLIGTLLLVGLGIGNGGASSVPQLKEAIMQQQKLKAADDPPAESQCIYMRAGVSTWVTRQQDVNGDDTLNFLDRFNVDCSTQQGGIKSWHFSRVGDKQAQIVFSCLGPLWWYGPYGTGTAIEEKTTPVQDGGPNLDYLDRHTLECGDDGVLVQFKLVNVYNRRKKGECFRRGCASEELPDGIQFKYKCAYPKPSQKVEGWVTPSSEIGPLVYLDRQTVACNGENEALNRFHWRRTEGNEGAFEYSCWHPNKC